jgi:hypothetical protein
MSVPLGCAGGPWVHQQVWINTATPQDRAAAFEAMQGVIGVRPDDGSAETFKVRAGPPTPHACAPHTPAHTRTHVHTLTRLHARTLTQRYESAVQQQPTPIVATSLLHVVVRKPVLCALFVITLCGTRTERNPGLLPVHSRSDAEWQCDPVPCPSARRRGDGRGHPS